MSDMSFSNSQISKNLISARFSDIDLLSNSSFVSVSSQEDSIIDIRESSVGLVHNLTMKNLNTTGMFVRYSKITSIDGLNMENSTA
mmetsp:Transcript_23075/g.26457  ORF Transcript_23075/g.26457 Transcript_23075/m.26457 type:complete len:86 (+) Transcript_23075:116-373(+)